MTVSILSAVQVSDQTAEIVWSDTAAYPAAGYALRRDVAAAGEVLIATVAAGYRRYVDPNLDAAAVGDSVAYRVTNLDDTEDDVAVFPVRALSSPFTYGPIQKLATAPRYTSIPRVKTALGLPASLTADELTRLTESIVAAEIAIDTRLGRSFPDTGDNPEYPAVPYDIIRAATAVAVRFHKGEEAPFGVAGSDDFGGGEINAGDLSILIRHPGLAGYAVASGLAL